MVDWERVAALRAELGGVDFMEVVAMFLNESDEVVERLRQGKPYPTLEAELHFLKGSALNLGFPDLAQSCSEGEKLAAAGHAADVAAILGCYAHTRRIFTKGCAGVARLTSDEELGQRLIAVMSR